jgi:hypothetical protein
MDWRQIEREIIEFFEEHGLRKERGGGDVFVEVVDDLVEGDDFNVTELARRIADLKSA